MSDTITNSTPTKYCCECGKIYKKYLAFCEHRRQCSLVVKHKVIIDNPATKLYAKLSG